MRPSLCLNRPQQIRVLLMVGAWWLIFRNSNAETKADSHPLPLIEEEIVLRAKREIVLGPGFKAWLSPDACGEVT